MHEDTHEWKSFYRSQSTACTTYAQLFKKWCTIDLVGKNNIWVLMNDSDCN